jgi:hypothetical protein
MEGFLLYAIDILSLKGNCMPNLILYKIPEAAKALLSEGMPGFLELME